MEAKRCSIQIQCSLIEHEHARFIESISGCLRTVSSLVKTAVRSELQQLAQLNAELSACVTAAADDAELLQHKFSLLSQQEESCEPPTWPSAGDRLLSSDVPPPSRDGSGAAAESGSFHSAAGRQDSVASVGSSPRTSLTQSRRSDRNVAMRHLRRTDPEPELPVTVVTQAGLVADSSGDSRSASATPAPGGGSGDGAASDRLPSREINLRVMHDVTLAHHDEHEDCDVLFLNLREDQPSLDTLCDDLEALSDDPRYALAAPPRRGDLVFARWDGACYRGRVARGPTADDDDTVEVQFVDYGNYDCVSLAECRRLPGRMARMPVCAVECTLTGAVAAPAGWQRQLQVLLLEALLRADAPVRALFQRPAGGGLLQAQLAVTASVGSESKVVDVGRTLNNVMAVSLKDAREQVESRNLMLETLMAPFVAQRRTGGGRSRVLDWLETGEQGEAGEPSPPPDAGPAEEPPLLHRPSNGRPKPTFARTDPAAGEPVGPVQAPCGSPVKAPQTFIDPPKYRHLTVCWDSRPIHRAPRELCARKTHRDIIIVKAHSPEDFYVSFESQDAFEDFQRQMQTVYGQLPAHPRQGLHRDLLRAGSFWAARYDGDEWCRVVILEELEPQGGDGVPSYRVRAVDFGDDLEVPAAHLRPMLEQFASQPVFIVRAACSGVAPLEGGTVYSEAARERFVDLVDVVGINAHTVSAETTGECLAVVLYKLEGINVLPVTEIMAQEDLVMHWQVLDDVCTPTLKSAATVNPVNVPLPPEDAHLPGDAGPPLDYTVPPPPPPLPSSTEDGWLLRQPSDAVRLPPAGAVVYVKVTAVVSPAMFYVVLPFGAQPAQVVNTDFVSHLQHLATDDSVETLAVAMRRFYGPRPAEGALPAGRPPPPGFSVAVRWQGGWHRGTVLTAAEDHAEVFLLDWGHTEPVPLEDLRELMRHFKQLPPQAVPCSLGSASCGPRPWPPVAVERLVSLAQHGLLLAHVLTAPPSAPSSASSRLLVDLYHATGMDDGVWASQFVCLQ